MESIRRTTFISSMFLLWTAMSASANYLELPLATSEAGIINFWPSLNASCDARTLEDDLCCLDSTFKDSSQSRLLLHLLLRRVPDPRFVVGGVSHALYKSINGIQVGTRYSCDIPLGGDEMIPGLTCHKCLEWIVDEISSGMLHSGGRCRNSWAMRYGYIFEPDTASEGDTTWCNLDYWFTILPSSARSSNKRSSSLLSEKINLARKFDLFLDFGRFALAPFRL